MDKYTKFFKNKLWGLINQFVLWWDQQKKTEHTHRETKLICEKKNQEK